MFKYFTEENKINIVLWMKSIRFYVIWYFSIINIKGLDRENVRKIKTEDFFLVHFIYCYMMQYNYYTFYPLTLSILVISRRYDVERKRNILRSVIFLDGKYHMAGSSRHQPFQIQSIHHTWLFLQQQVLVLSYV